MTSPRGSAAPGDGGGAKVVSAVEAPAVHVDRRQPSLAAGPRSPGSTPAGAARKFRAHARKKLRRNGAGGVCGGTDPERRRPAREFALRHRLGIGSGAGVTL